MHNDRRKPREAARIGRARKPYRFPKSSLNFFHFFSSHTMTSDDLWSTPWPPHWTWDYTGYFLCMSILTVKRTHTPSTVIKHNPRQMAPCKQSRQDVLQQVPTMCLVMSGLQRQKETVPVPHHLTTDRTYSGRRNYKQLPQVQSQRF